MAGRPLEQIASDDARLASPGSFGLMVGPRDARPHFIGRDDRDVGAGVRALLAAGCPSCGTTLHGAQVEPRATPAEAYADQCRLWHRYAPVDCNAVHPTGPAGAACPEPDCAG